MEPSGTAEGGTRPEVTGGRRLWRPGMGVLVALLLGALVAGCSGDDAMSAGSGGGDADGQAAAMESADSQARTANRAPARARAVIRTGQVAVTSEDLDERRAEVDRLLFVLDGSIDREETSHDDEGNIERSTLVLRVPVAKFAATMDALEKLGKVETSDTRSKDVTTEVIDVGERVQTIQNSLDRLQSFQRRSEDIDDLIRFEDQITERESQLRSLQARQDYLADQTSMATITLYLSTPENYVAPDALEDAGFLAGLKGGWNALTDAVVVALTVVGALLPFAVALALVGVPVWLLVRNVTRRRPDGEPLPSPEPPAA